MHSRQWALGIGISDETGSQISISDVSLVRFSDLFPIASGDAQRLFELVDMMNIRNYGTDGDISANKT